MAKKGKEEVVEPVEVSRLEFLDLLRREINTADDTMLKAQDYIDMYTQLFSNIEIDEINYNLKYYIIGDGLSYKRCGKKKIGF